MRLPWRRAPERPPDEYPEEFVKAWMARTLPTTTAPEAKRAVEHLRSKGWSEDKLARFIVPYMPRDPGPRDGPPAMALPAHVTEAWLERHLPAMDRDELARAVADLERRGWPPARVAVAVLPHLLPKLPPEDASAIVAGLPSLGLSDEQIARATQPR